MPKVPDGVRDRCKRLLMDSLVTGSGEVDHEHKIKSKRLKVFKEFTEIVEDITHRDWALRGTVSWYRDRVVQQSRVLSLKGALILKNFQAEEFANIDWIDNAELAKKVPELFVESPGWKPLSEEEIAAASADELNEFPVVGADDGVESFQKLIPGILGLSESEADKTTKPCKYCGSKEVTAGVNQMKSGDEGQTATFTCRTCSKTWRES